MGETETTADTTGSKEPRQAFSKGSQVIQVDAQTGSRRWCFAEDFAMHGLEVLHRDAERKTRSLLEV